MMTWLATVTYHAMMPWEDMTPPAIELPPRPKQGSYQRPPMNEQFFVPNHYPYD